MLKQAPAMVFSVIRIELFVLLVALAGVAAFQILTGRINTVGLLRSAPGAPISATSVQMLFGTFIAAGWYLQLVLTTHDLPEPPTALLALLGGSQAIHLGGKAAGLLGLSQAAKRNN